MSLSSVTVDINSLVAKLNAVDNPPVFSFKGLNAVSVCIGVCDGDTIWIKTEILCIGVVKIKCRLLGCDTSEIKLGGDNTEISKKLGLRAKEFVSKLILNKTIIVEFDDFDLYGRPLIKVKLLDAILPINNVYLNDLLILKGHAVKWDDSKDRKTQQDAILIKLATDKGLDDMEEICNEIICTYAEWSRMASQLPAGAAASSGSACGLD